MFYPDVSYCPFYFGEFHPKINKQKYLLINELRLENFRQLPRQPMLEIE